MSGKIMGQQQKAVLIILLQVMMIMFSVNLICCDTEFLIREGSYDSSPFPSNFLFGTASSAYQFEGGYLDDGKGLNNWDVFTHTNPGKITNGNNGDVAADHYHRYMEDINLMASIGVNSYRFSISWARILPKGRFGDINFAGIDHYNKLIDALLEKGIQPFVTMTHLDFPQEMEDRYRSWLSPESQKDFAYYAEICFKYFGDRVKYWVTFNEPNFQAKLGYQEGIYPPSRCSTPFGNCTDGDSEYEPFIVAHNIILAHARTAHIYRTKYKKQQGGSVGIVLHAIWFEPMTNTEADKLAAERAQSFFMNWFLDPIMFGRYPVEMEKILGSNLPRFSGNEMNYILKNGLDFIGINHYTSYYVQDCLLSACEPGMGVSRTEGFARSTPTKNGVPIGNVTDLDWLYVFPEGMRKIVNYVKDRYNNIPMFITENGYGEEDTNTNLENLLHDSKRVDYLAGYLESLTISMREGADVRGYFVWSILDGFEWLAGFSVRFGLHHVDYTTLSRTPKLSASWFSDFISRHKTTSLPLGKH